MVRRKLGLVGFPVLLLGAILVAACGGSPVPAPLSRWREPATGMEFIYVPPARFLMGSPPGIAGRPADEVQHEVQITRGYYLGRYEVTQGEWVEVMGENPSQFPDCGLRCPVETVSYLVIQQFIRRLEALSPGNRFRLPTEAEWELACRAGTTTPFSTGDTLGSERANIDGRYPYCNGPMGVFRGSPAPVGSYPPNPWGFCDMHGNLWEWCEDWYGPYATEPVRDPRGPASGTRRVIRGGSWYFDANSARSALRYTHRPQDDGFSLGFRLVRDEVQ